MVSTTQKLKMLAWKNIIVQARQCAPQDFSAFFTIIALPGILLLHHRMRVDPYHTNYEATFTPLQTKSFVQSIDSFDRKITLPPYIAYSPKNPVLQELVTSVFKQLQLPAGGAVIALDDDQDLERFLIENRTFVGIEFDNSYKSVNELPKSLKYSIRFPDMLRSNSRFSWKIGKLFPPTASVDIINPKDEDGGAPANYFREGFLGLQHLIFVNVFEKIKTSSADIPDMYIERFPYPTYTKDKFNDIMTNFGPLLIFLSFNIIYIKMLEFIVIEKEKQLKETMKMMGLTNSMHWATLFPIYLVSFMVACFIMTGYFCIPFENRINTAVKVSVLKESNFVLIWLLLFVFSIATITFTFLVSTFFYKSVTASVIGGGLFTLFYIVYLVFPYDTTGLFMKILLSLSSNMALYYGITITIKYEIAGEGLQWNNLFTPVSEGDEFSVGLFGIILLVDAVIYLLLALCIERVYPGKYGVREPCNFCVKNCTKKEESIEVINNIPEDKLNNVEAASAHLEAGISIRGLTKEFSNKLLAVNDLYLDMYKNQITVLLGHNGAGKTTTMSMLAGLLRPSSGTALINGEDIRTKMNSIRHSLGFCPQYNVLFDELTVQEHLNLFGKLKGIESGIDDDVNRMVEALGLNDKMNARANTLSGGMKRRLSVGIALIGDSKVVILDEPTSGMDPASRRFLWNLLAVEKRNRTVLISTHFLDEADVLGDRIAIMTNGELSACGSSFYLKKKFGTGYRLICVKAANCIPENVTKLLQSYIPDLQVNSNVGSEISYLISDEHLSKFQNILTDLEKKSEALGILSYGISRTTLEEVFQRVGTDKRKSRKSRNSRASFVTTNLIKSSLKLYGNQCKAMLLKKYYTTKRSLFTLIFMILLPIFFLLIFFINNIIARDDTTQRLITTDSYEQLNILLNDDFKDSRIFDSYMEFGKRSNVHVEAISDNMQDHILKISKNNLIKFNQDHIVAASLMKDRFIAWFNNKAYHSAPLSMSLIHDAILKAHCGSDCGISVTNKPVIDGSEKGDLLQLSAFAVLLAFNISLCWALVGSFVILFYIRERVSGAKLLQFVNGVNIFIFWGISFLWDFVLLFLVSLINVGTIAVFQKENFSTMSELGFLVLLFIFVNWAFLPIIYIFSYIFNEPANGYSCFFTLNLIGPFLFLLMASFNNWFSKHAFIRLILLVFPLYAFADALTLFNRITTYQKICYGLENYQDIAQCQNLNYFDVNYGFGINLIYMFLVGVLCFVFLILLNFKVCTVIERCLDSVNYMCDPLNVDVLDDLDNDVEIEKSKIEEMSTSEILLHPLIVKNVSKFYNSEHAVVNQAYLQVERSDCFGLLGVNGAGKTTTFKMLTGDISITSGNAWVHGASVTTNLPAVYKRIGYCPQFDMLLDDLTGRETIKICCLLRGVRGIPELTQTLIEKLNFAGLIDKKVGEYSGGNKRKLSFAVALIGNPSILFLDEPSSGMDPGARRQLWNLIREVRDGGQAVVLSSHNMDECEALCTRLTVMVDGVFKCLGSIQYLKNKFARGYQLNIKIASHSDDSSDVIKNDIIAYITTQINGSILKEQYENNLVFEIPHVEHQLSQLFGIVQSGKDKLHIEDYSLGQLSIEQVFLSFVKE